MLDFAVGPKYAEFRAMFRNSLKSEGMVYDY
jgi:hypothetical protein